MKVKTRVHVSVYMAGLVEIEIDSEGGTLDIVAHLQHCSDPSINGCAMPSVTASESGQDATQELNERITRIAGHLLIQEVESVVRARIEETGAVNTPVQLASTPGAKA